MRQLFAAALLAVSSFHSSAAGVVFPNYDVIWSTSFPFHSLVFSPDKFSAIWTSDLRSSSINIDTRYHNPDSPIFGVGASFDLLVRKPTDVQLGSSYRLQYQFEVFDVTANQVVESMTADIFGRESRQISFELFNEYILPSAAQLRITGAYTLSYPDCQGLACLQTWSDDITPTFKLTLAPVPEPSTRLTFLLGIVAAASVAWRRRPS